VIGPWAKMCDSHHEEHGYPESIELNFRIQYLWEGVALIELLTGEELHVTECEQCCKFRDILEWGQSPGFAGPISWWTMECGHTGVDTSGDNLEAAR